MFVGMENSLYHCSLIESIVLENKEIIIERWRSYFNNRSSCDKFQAGRLI